MKREEPKDKRLRYKVEGLTCTGCAMDLETHLKGLDGVLDAEVRYGDDSISIRHNPFEVSGTILLKWMRRSSTRPSGRWGSSWRRSRDSAADQQSSSEAERETSKHLFPQ
jgi:copper chaperone CopZ